MNIFSRVVNAVRGKSIYQGLPDNLQGNGGWEFLSGFFSTWQKANSIFGNMTTLDFERAFSNHPIVRACANKIAETAAIPRIEVGLYVQDQWVPSPIHPVLDLIKSPNEEYSENDFIAYMVSRLELTGYAYAPKIRGGGKKVVQLWPVPTNWVTPLRATGGSRMWRAYKVFGQDKEIPVEDMIVMRNIDPATTYGATCPLMAAAHDYRVDMEREAYIAEMLINMKMPGLMISTDRALTPTARTEIQKTLDARVGRGNRGNALVLEGAKGEMIAPLADFDWPSITTLVETRICSAFGVPPIIIHARAGLERATYSNYEQARRAFYVDTMAPVWDRLADALTLGLLKSEGEARLEVRFRYDELAEFQEDETKKVARIAQKYAGGRGWITLDEAREEDNYDPAQPGDFPEPAAAQIVDATPGAQVPAKAAAQ